MRKARFTEEQIFSDRRKACSQGPRRFYRSPRRCTRRRLCAP